MALVTKLFLPTAQAPGGSETLAIALASATEKLAGNATAAASIATFTIDIIFMVIPRPLRKKFYVVPTDATYCRSWQVGARLYYAGRAARRMFC
jgi:hypothetical protein